MCLNLLIYKYFGMSLFFFSNLKCMNGKLRLQTIRLLNYSDF
jgi:hypothetical protein